ncbi:type II secretion system secretin GspD [Limnohabitans radicicola]|uniref:Type II secretion system secretin GspD n=1 Tax=Limnohabitans radicicola TaxID=2771427 RepID=A0A927IIE4_9BURK|nr:type II secretion system secretin GspD [Limnohabitans radicicola]MBD8049519.1 type II secretion system secretin GspD [Limnohabitans radicicola]
MHTSRLHPILGLSALALACTLSAGLASAQTAADGKTAVRAGEQVVLNFVNADIEAVARTVATLSGHNVVVDPRVKGTMTLSSTVAVAPAQALRLFGAQLRTQGFALVESSGLYTVVPEAEAKLQSGPVSAGAVPAGSGQVVTQIFRLNHESASNLVPVLRPLISPNNTINITPGTNALVITDYADNLQRLSRIVAALDVANASGVEVIRLKHGIASDMAAMVQRLVDSGAAATAAAPGQTDSGFRTTVLAEVRTNALIVRAANPARTALVRSLIEQLDQPSATGASAASGNIHVVYLKNADATKLATTLRAAMAASGSTANTALTGASAVNTPPMTGAAAGTPAGASASVQPSTGGQIQADPATNALIITAPEPQYRQLREVIDKLDQRRAQVYVESLIAEVSADKAAEFGVQWMSGTGTTTGKGTVGLLGTNFSVGGTNLLTLGAAAANGNYTASTGLNLAVGQQRNGALALGALARFLQSSGDGNVLSTPNLLTLDNEEAKIVIGQNVPFVTGSYAAATAGTTNPFTTVERKDVGLTLKVKPQISENGTVKMQIFQEVSSVVTASIDSKNGPITNKRSIESNVLVEDGSIVVLGGLLQDDATASQEKVPGMGDIPLFGNLFKAETRTRKKTNLMVFLRPVVVRDGAATEALSLGRYEQMRLTQQGIQPVNGAPSVQGSAVLPELQATPVKTPPAAKP